MQNKRVRLVGAVSIILIMAGIFWWNTANSIKTEANIVDNESVAAISPFSESKAAETMVENVLVEPSLTEEELMTEGVVLRIGSVATAYAENMRYPKYSKPLSANDWVALNPRAFVPKDMPLEIQDGLSAAIVLPQYVANRDNDLPVQVRINGLNKGLSIDSVLVYVQSDTEHEHSITLSSYSSTDGSMIYAGDYPSVGFPENVSNESYLYADIAFSNNELITISAVYLLEDNVATLTSLGNAYVDGAHLIIPASFDVELAGFYRFQANLFEQESEQPISHLNATFMLTKTDSHALLQVHAETLRLKGSPGPYMLTDINITRSPTSPGDRTGYGSAEKDFYLVDGFDLSYYSEEKYVNPENERRLEFLQKMAGQE